LWAFWFAGFFPFFVSYLIVLNGLFVNKNLPKLKDLLNSKTQSLTQTVRDTMDILNSTAEKCSNQRKYGKNKLKWNIWNNNIKEAIKNNKIALPLL
jgi:hypothetical protein